jgi:hypothetical protein
MDTFDFVNEISDGKNQLIVDEQTEEIYNPFIVNRALSYHRDCIIYANEMNIHPNVDKKLQFDFFINTIRSRKRPRVKWIKPEKAKDVESIKMIYNMSSQKASEVISLLSESQLKIIKNKTDIGGY